ncbi:hypothetical protein DFR52_10871 [Hoeflea marina]|uniref:Uncharacterized protein n=1 Tax=Hoeflea marina TaxID=274592 RepID=A0A317PCT5_9HYPH|nr:hypothetical protein [Hoeflea marina]PWV95807.1 hypothetical protein DFR52_10871 [Hoeflea marina]
MKDALHVLEKRDLPVRKTIRRARWFVAAFRDFLGTVEDETKRSFILNEAHLMSAFTAWFRAFEAQKYKAKEHRLEYVTFAAGLMLRELVRYAPVSVAPVASPSDQTVPAKFWPEGYLYVTFCLAVREAVIEQDFSLVKDTTPELADLRTWWSFRENTQEDIDMAVGFFERFAGETPNWSMPGLFLPKDDETRLPNSRQ